MSARPSASASIDAPLDVVWAVMLDTAAYGEWNPFVYQVECPSPAKVGDPIKLHVRWSNGKTTSSPERITVIEPPHDVDGVRTALLSYEYEGLPDGSAWCTASGTRSSRRRRAGRRSTTPSRS